MKARRADIIDQTPTRESREELIMANTYSQIYIQIGRKVLGLFRILGRSWTR
jgi:hypothetical protein